MKIFETVGAIVVIAVVILAICLVYAFPVMWLWNWLMPDLFGLQTITVGQSLGLCLLTGLLFGRTGTTTNKK